MRRWLIKKLLTKQEVGLMYFGMESASETYLECAKDRRESWSDHRCAESWIRYLSRPT